MTTTATLLHTGKDRAGNRACVRAPRGTAWAGFLRVRLQTPGTCVMLVHGEEVEAWEGGEGASTPHVELAAERASGCGIALAAVQG